jgi:hypothetical protein
MRFVMPFRRSGRFSVSRAMPSATSYRIVSYPLMHRVYARAYDRGMWLRLRQIALVARELRPVLDDLQAVLGIEPCYVDPGVKAFGLENTLLPVGNQLLEVVAPIRAGTAGGRHLERRGGDGGYMVITQCDDHEPRSRRVAELGIRKVLEFDVPGQFRDMQLHPKDTGGAFLEIDEQLGPRAHEPDGPWHPAGHDWQRARRTERVPSSRRRCSATSPRRSRRAGARSSRSRSGATRADARRSR